MIKLSFIVDKNFILQHILKSFSKERDFNILKRSLWQKNKNLYYILSQNIEPLTFSQNFSKELNKIKNFKKDLDFIYLSKKFMKIISEAEKYASFIEKQWVNNYEISLKHLENITKLPLLKNKLNIQVYISHPKLFKGRAYPDFKVITWAHSEDWKNYSTIYLWHEIMHHITYKYRGDQNLLHALIELVCDNELRIRLNNGGVYFKAGKYKIGHWNLVKLEKKILKDWKIYLSNPKLNVYKLEKRLRDRLPRRFLFKETDLNRWAEWH